MPEMPINLSLPDSKDYEYGYELAYKLACEKLAAADIEQQCLRSEARCQSEGAKKVVVLEYLHQPYQITLPHIQVSLKASGGEVGVRDRILIVHYFIQAKGAPLSNKVISYKELPEGVNYFPTFSKRAIKPLVDNFGREPQRLLDVAGTLGGRRVDYGDVAVSINAFSRVPVTLVLWRGDEEFPANGNILFDSTISDYLTTEDVNVLCEIIAWRLVRSFRQR